LSINRFEDFGFETEPKEEHSEWSNYLSVVENSFPKYSLKPLTDDAVQAELVAAWEASYLANKPADDGSQAWKKWNEWGNWVVWCLKNTPKESWLLPQYLTEDADIE
jgi:hypothetical protein